MKAIILAGGLGTRLRPLTYRRPKPVTPLMGRPFLEYQLKWLARHGIKEIALCLHYRAEQVERALGDGRSYGLHLTYIYEETPLGTGGALVNTIGFWGDERVAVINGDVLVDLDLYGMVDLHIARKAVATIALVRVSDPTAYGLVLARPGGRVERFLEKPSWDQASGHSINAGVYILEPAVTAQIPAGREVSIEREVFPSLLSEGYSVFSYHEPFYWLDIGTPEKLMQAHFDLLDRKVTADLPEVQSTGHAYVDPGSTLSPSAQLVPPVFVADRVEVADDAVLGPYTVIGSGSIVGAGSEVRHSVLMEESRIGDDCLLSRCLLDQGAQVGDKARLTGWLLSADSRVAGGSRSIHPGEDGDS